MRRSIVQLAYFALAAFAVAVQIPVFAQASSGEARAARAYQAAAHDGPQGMRAFLDQFPKGADLHIHLSGAIYAESFIRDAGEDKLCIDPAELKFARDAQGNPIKEPCAPPLTPAAQVTSNQALYDRLVNAFSMRGFVATNGFSGHDQFFSTFERFAGINRRHIGEWVDEVASRAAQQNQPDRGAMLFRPNREHRVLDWASPNGLPESVSASEPGRALGKVLDVGLP